MGRWALVAFPKRQAIGWEELASNYVRGGLAWILGKISSLKWWTSTGGGYPGKWWKHCSWCDESNDCVRLSTTARCSEGTGEDGRALYIKSVMSSLKNSRKQVESLWVKIRDWGNKGSLVIGVHSKLPVAEASLLQLQEVAYLQTLVLLRGFDQPGTHWKCSIANLGMHGG